MIDYADNTLHFDCPECKNTMKVEFREDFHPRDHPNFKFCCLACKQKYIITNWAPVWIIKDLPASGTVSQTVAQA